MPTPRRKRTEQEEAPATPAMGWPVRLTLPLPRSVNSIWRQGVTKKKIAYTYLTKEGRAYKKCLTQELADWAKEHRIGCSGRLVEVKVWVFWPNAARDRDAANTEKLFSDALQEVLWENDHQAFPQFQPPHHVDEDNPRLEILATEWDGVDSVPAFEGYTTVGLAVYARSQVAEAAARKQKGIDKARLTRLAKKAAASAATGG